MTKQTSLRRKLLLMIAIAIGCAQLLVAATTIWLEATRYAASKQDVLFSEGRIMAAAVSHGTAARDPSQIYAALRAMGQVSGTSFIAVDDTAGQELAALGAAERLSSDLVIDADHPSLRPLDLLVTRSIAVRVPVKQSGRIVGELELIADAADFKQQLAATVKIALASLALALVVAAAIAWWMQRAITRPVTDLRNAMDRVASDHNYTLALASSPLKELALLIGGFNAMLSQIRDRDERIARSYLELEQQVADRTQDLRVAKEQAESANAQKSDFLATMSHEIRTPMNGMLVMAELLAQAQLPSRCRRYAQVIWRSGQSLLAIINDILDLSKIEAGKLDLEATRLDIRDLVQTTLDLFSERARSKGLDLAASIAPDVPLAVTGDPVRLAQILSNFLNNALKFTERGGVRLDVRVADDRLHFSVRDTGIGIAEDKLASVFEAFSQADQSTTRKFGGTGLGLAICRKLVEAMGSEIALTSRLGEGSIFSFSLAIIDPEPCERIVASGDTLPVSIRLSGAFTPAVLIEAFAAAGFRVIDEAQPDAVDVPSIQITRIGDQLDGQADVHRARGGISILVVDPDSDPASFTADATLTWPLAAKEVSDLIERIVTGRPLADAGVTPQAAASGTFPGLHVLVADDTDINCEVAREALSRLGATAETVPDGAAALAALERGSFGVVLMDGSMPVMDGFAATRAIRLRESETGTRRTPIVALTANVIGTSGQQWMDAGADAILSKPFSVADLRSVLARVLGSEPVLAVAPADVQSASSPPALSNAEDYPILDASVLGELRGLAAAGQPDFLRRVIGLYVDHAPQALNDVRSHHDAGAVGPLAKSAHALKSMSLNIGARRVAAIAGQIEREARSDALPSRETIAALAAQFEEACALLATEVELSAAA